MLRLISALMLMIVMGAYAASPTTSHENEKIRFTWGAEFGSAIDMSGNDMSSIDFNAAFGMRRDWIKFLGAGVGADIMVSNSCRTYPLFIIFQPSLPKVSNLVFLDIRGGAALNYLSDNISQTTAYGHLCIGFNLASGSKFRSYLIAGYEFVERRDVITETRSLPFPSLHKAVVRLGITF